MEEEQAKFKIGKQEAARDIINVVGEFISKQLPQKEKLPPSLNNQTSPEPNFTGRTDILKVFTVWWDDPKVRIGALTGWGGMGKSAVLRKWYEDLEQNNIHPDGVFWWGFYRNANLELFLNALLDFTSGGRMNSAEIKNNWDKVEKIKRYLQQDAFLVILDGFETMQKNESSGEFGATAHRECQELLTSIVDFKEKHGLCLITTRFPLNDLINWKGRGFQQQEVGEFSLDDTRAFFRKIGVKGADEEIDVVWKSFRGHLLSLRLLAGYLVEDYGGDIHRVQNIPPFYSDTEAGGKAHRMLRWYDKQLTQEQQLFMKIFSLFREVVRQEDFEGIFQAEIETKANQKLKDMSIFSFERMKDNLCNRRLISNKQDGTYDTHPLIKNYFESIIEEKDKRAYHKCIYSHCIGKNVSSKPETLEDMQPLFEQVYHGCKAGLYDEVHKLYVSRIKRDEGVGNFLTDQFGAENINFLLMLNFFPSNDFLKMPLVRLNNDKAHILNEIGYSLKNMGRPFEAEKLLAKILNMRIRNYFQDYLNLAELQLHMGKIDSAIQIAEKAIGAELLKGSPKMPRPRTVRESVYLAYFLLLAGETVLAKSYFSEAVKDIGGSIEGIFCVDFCILMQDVDLAQKIAKQTFDMCKEYNWVVWIGHSLRALGAVKRIQGRDFSASEDYLQQALKIAKKISFPELEIQVLIERGRLWLNIEKYKEAIVDANEVLKLVGRTGFKLYEPDAEMVLAKAYLALALEDINKAKEFANLAYQKAHDMHYRWTEAESAHTLGEIFLKQSEKNEARDWLTKAIFLRKKILDPKVFDSEILLQDL